MRIPFLSGLLAVVVSLLSAGMLSADEVGDLLAVEDVSNGGSHPATPALGAGISAPQVQVPRATAVKAADVALLMESLRQKDVALKEAHQEIERLRGYIQKIAVASRRERVVAHYNLGCIYKAAKHHSRAEEEFLKAEAIDPNDAGVHYNLAILYDDDLNDKKKAKQHYEKFLELAPNDRDAPKVREWLVSLP